MNIPFTPLIPIDPKPLIVSHSLSRLIPKDADILALILALQRREDLFRRVAGHAVS